MTFQHVSGRMPFGLAALAVALMLCATLAADSRASEVGIAFSSKEPGTRSAMTLHIRYTNPSDPDAKPPAIRRLQVDAPAGTVFRSWAVPRCRASNLQLTLFGPGACPSASRIGGGPIAVVTGLGSLFDPFVLPTPVFNDGAGWIEVSHTPNPVVTIAVTRLTVSGSRIVGNVAASAGGPPDFNSAVSTVDLSFPAHTGYVITPPTCPPDGRWVTTGTFTFANGTTEVVHGDTPCVVH